MTYLPSFDKFNHILDIIKDQYGVDAAFKPKMLSKFGRLESLGTSYETVQEQGGNEAYLSSNLIDTIVSTDSGDAQAVAVEGHTIDGSGNLTFVSQQATLNGTSEVSLATPLARATRIQNKGATSFAGIVKAIDSDFSSVVYVQAGGTFNRSQKAATSISQYDYWVLTKVYGSVLKKTSASVDFSLQSRESGGVSQEIYGFDGSSSAQNLPHDLDPPIIIPSNSDVRLIGRASTSDVEVIGRISGWLAIDRSAL